MMRWCVIEKTWHWQQHRQRRRREMCAQIAVLTNWVISQHVLFWHYPTPSQTDCWTQRDQNDSLLTILSNVGGDGSSTMETTTPHSNPTCFLTEKCPFLFSFKDESLLRFFHLKRDKKKSLDVENLIFCKKSFPFPSRFNSLPFFSSQFWSVNLGRNRIQRSGVLDFAQLRVPSNITVRLCSLTKYGVPSLWHFYSAYNIIQLPLSLPSPSSLDD